MALLKQLIVLLMLTYFGNVMSVDNFACGDGTMIPFSWTCDNVKDCANGMDEVCDHLHYCNVDEYMCKSGECLPASIKCNGVFDCSDGSDERDCQVQKNDGSGIFYQHFLSYLWLPAFWTLTFIVAQF